MSSQSLPNGFAPGATSTGLRVAAHRSEDASAAVLARYASLEGRDVASLRCLGVEGGFAVECQVHPARDPDAGPRELGPYSFERLEDARRFVDEVSLALEYLGCEVDADRRASPQPSPA